MSISLTGRIYPDRSLSIGRVAPKKKLTAEREYDHAIEQLYVTAIERVHSCLGVQEVVHHLVDPTVSPSKFIKGVESSPKRKREYGTKGITRFGRKFVRNASLVFQKKIGRKCMGFGTCTVPGLSVEEHTILRRHWHDVVRKFYQKLRRHYKKQGEVFDYVSVTEIQEKRYLRTNCPVPHLHFVYNCVARPNGAFIVSAREVRTYWWEVVTQVLKKNYPGYTGYSEHHFNASVNLQKVKKSACNYLSKYMSKGSQCMDAMKEAGHETGVRQWWTASQQVKKDFRDAVIELPNGLAEQIFYEEHTFLESSLITWLKRIYVVVSGGAEVQVGLACKISREFYGMFSEVIYS